MVRDLIPGATSSSPGDLVVLGDAVYFRAYTELDASKPGLWRYVASEDALSLIPNTTNDEVQSPTYLTVYDDKVFFRQALVEETPEGTAISYELWAYDASADVASPASDMNLSWGNNDPVVLGDRLYLGAYSEPHGQELWMYDAASNQSQLVEDLQPGTSNSGPRGLTPYNGKLYFSADADANGENAGREPWVYDPVSGEVELIDDLAPGSQDSSPSQFTVYGGQLFFSAETDSDNNFELWAYDDVTDEATMVFSDASVFEIGTTYDGRLFFSARQDGQVELWAYDGATGESTLVLDLCQVSGGTGSFPKFMTPFNGHLLFSATDCTSGRELWSYSGPNDATIRIADINPGPDGSFVWDLTEYEGHLLFSANDGERGSELWSVSPAGLGEEPMLPSQSVQLRSTHPNPARAGATVSFDLAEPAQARIEIFDLLGRRVALLADDVMAASEHTLTWQADGLPSGVYVVRLTAGDVVQTQRLTLVR